MHILYDRSWELVNHFTETLLQLITCWSRWWCRSWTNKVSILQQTIVVFLIACKVFSQSFWNANNMRPEILKIAPERSRFMGVLTCSCIPASLTVRCWYQHNIAVSPHKGYLDMTNFEAIHTCWTVHFNGKICIAPSRKTQPTRTKVRLATSHDDFVIVKMIPPTISLRCSLAYPDAMVVRLLY